LPEEPEHVQKFNTLRLGTRSSLLALAQSRQIKAALEYCHENLRVELVEFQTQGDRDLNTPLSAVSHSDFFSDTLDAALINKSIDFCVHSYKDLAFPRPDALHIAAIPERENPADVVIFRRDIDSLLEAGQRIRIGSSSLRRKINTSDFLITALPNLSDSLSIEFQTLRGSVVDRLQRLLPGAEDQRLDGVVLALAGLNRLWADKHGRAAIREILAQTRWMVLPLSECPTAMGQGALAIECRSDDTETQSILSSVHDTPTAKLLDIERTMLREEVAQQNSNNANHLGVSAIQNSELGYIARLRGREAETDEATYACKTAQQPGKPATARPWNSSNWRKQIKRTALPVELPTAAPLFIAHWQALENINPAADTRCWTSGTASWRELARRGIWVEGCTDHMGFTALHESIACAVLQLPALADWCALTHAGAVSSWEKSGVGNTIATYKVSTDIQSDSFNPEEIVTATHFFWRTAAHFESLRHLVSSDAHHACGPGKTLHTLKAAGLKNISPFPSHKEWQQWLN
jgi:hydroxymethylbilane synthase